MSKIYGVTGVASGIGAELARILKERGHQVVGFDLRETSVNVDQFIQIDMNDEDAIAQAAAAVDTPLDGLCNNAGLPPRDGWEEMILQVNFLAPRAFTAAMLPHLKEGAAIVNMASRAGQFWPQNLDQIKRLGALRSRDQLADFVAAEGLDPTACYNLSKEAIIVWTMAEAERMTAAGLRMNSLSPAAVATGILDDFKRAFGDKVARNVQRAGRPGKPEEIAEIAAFYLSPESWWVKGADIWIDGGMAAFAATDAMGTAGMRLD